MCIMRYSEKLTTIVNSLPSVKEVYWCRLTMVHYIQFIVIKIDLGIKNTKLVITPIFLTFFTNLENILIKKCNNVY